MPIRLRALFGAAALLAVVLPCSGCRADRSSRGATAAPPIGRVLAIQSAHPDSPIPPLVLPTEIVPIPDQEVRRLAAAGSQANTLRGTRFDAFEPGVHVACLADGTTAVELAWRSSWFQSYHLVFLLAESDRGHEVTHLGLLENGDARDEWMTIRSARLGIHEDAQRIQLAFSLTGRWAADGEPLSFEGCVTADREELARATAMLELGAGGRAAMEMLRGKE